MKGDDVYVGNSKSAMGTVKFSLHASGVWVYSFTTQSNSQVNGNRRMHRWQRPAPLANGAVRGLTVVVPTTSLWPRRVSKDELTKKISWYPKAPDGFSVDFTVLFLPEGHKINWENNFTVISDLRRKDGSHVVVLASCNVNPEGFARTVDHLLTTPNNTFTHSSPDWLPEGAFLWITTSADVQKTPLVVDLPMPIKFVGKHMLGP